MLAGHLLGWTSIGCVEIDAAAVAVLESHGECVLARDIKAFDAKPLRGHVDVVVGGFPCQDVSLAGRRAGFEGARSSLWFEMVRVIQECKPTWVFGENVRGLLSSQNGADFETVLKTLGEIGYDVKWAVVSAASVGAPHRRERVWIVAKMVADAGRERDERRREFGEFPSTAGSSESQARERERGGHAAGSGLSLPNTADGRQPGGEPEREPVHQSGEGAMADHQGVGRSERGAEPAWSQGGPSAELGSPAVAHAGGLGHAQQRLPQHAGTARPATGRAGDGGPNAAPEPGLGGVPDGLAAWMDQGSRWPAGKGQPQYGWEPPRIIPKEQSPGRTKRLKILGNGWVPQAAVRAWNMLSKEWPSKNTTHTQKQMELNLDKGT